MDGAVSVRGSARERGQGFKPARETRPSTPA